MNLRQLRYLVALADERHFTRAAAREHVAQPALSQQIRSLEAELGMQLVERTTRRVSMTQAGELLVARARRALAELDAAQAELQSLAGVQTGRLAVGALHTMGPVDLSLLLATFHERHPGVELTVREQSSEELAGMLREDEIDLAFLSVTERIQSRGLRAAPARPRGARRRARLPPSARRAAAAAPRRARGRGVHHVPRGRAAA